MPANTKIEKLADWFLKTNNTLSLAESCTGGLLSAHLVALPGVSKFYLGGVVSYSYAMKEDLLSVPSHILKSMGAVSVPVARYMASGVKEVSGSSWALSITGIAGPDGGTEDKPVGTVCFGVCGPGFEYTETQVFEGQDRQAIQEASVNHAINLLWEKTQS